MADDAPSWLNETPDAPAVTVPTTPAEPAASAPAPAPKASKKKSKEPAQDVENVAPASPQDLEGMFSHMCSLAFTVMDFVQDYMNVMLQNRITRKRSFF